MARPGPSPTWRVRRGRSRSPWRGSARTPSASSTRGHAADPAAYVVDTDALDLAAIATGDPVLVRGFVRPESDATADFDALAIADLTDVEATLLVRWALPGIAAPFLHRRNSTTPFGMRKDRHSKTSCTGLSEAASATQAARCSSERSRGRASSTAAVNLVLSSLKHQASVSDASSTNLTGDGLR